MIEAATPTDDLIRLGRAAAEEVAGAAAVEHVEVALGEDWVGDPVYRFTFLIDIQRALRPPGDLRIVLGHHIRDALLARNDSRYPMLRILDRADWSNLRRA